MESIYGKVQRIGFVNLPRITKTDSKHNRKREVVRYHLARDGTVVSITGRVKVVADLQIRARMLRLPV